MSLSRMYTPVLHFDDINGRPLVGGKLYTYEANSSTPAPTYRDKSGTLLNENPISLDERGECEAWLVDGLRYKMVLVDPIGTQIWEADDVSSMSDVSNASIDVDGTSPVKVSKSVVNGVTKYTVSLEKSFVDEVHDNTRNIANETERAQGAEQNLSQSINTVSSQLATETTRAQNAENTLSERIETVNTSLSNETYRAKTAEAAARTVVRAGEGIQVDKVVDPLGDGHDEYFVSTDIHGSCLLTPMSEWQTLDGTDKVLRYVWSSGTPTAVTGDKIRLATAEGQTKYHIEVAALGAYRVDFQIGVKWDGTPVNKTGDLFGFACDFSRHFKYWIGRQSNIIEVPYNQKPYYGFGFPVPASMIDSPNGVKLAIQALVEYLGPVPKVT